MVVMPILKLWDSIIYKWQKHGTAAVAALGVKGFAEFFDGSSEFDSAQAHQWTVGHFFAP